MYYYYYICFIINYKNLNVMSNIWKEIKINYDKPYYIVKLDQTRMNFSKTRHLPKSVINKPYKTLKECKEKRKELSILFPEDKYIIVCKKGGWVW